MESLSALLALYEEYPLITPNERPAILRTYGVYLLLTEQAGV